MLALKIAIVEDTERDREHLASLLRNFEDERGMKFSVRTFSDGAAILDAYQPEYDIIFFDIKMGGIDGMSAAKKIRAMDSKVIIIFVTQTSQYATTGYEVSAQSYLLKPVTPFALATELDRAIGKLESQERPSVLFGSGPHIRRIDVSDILYVESNRHRITVRTTSGDIVFSGTLKEVASQLEQHNFTRANSGYLVNLLHVRAIVGDDVAMANGDMLKISRARKKPLMEALTKYIGTQI